MNQTTTFQKNGESMNNKPHLLLIFLFFFLTMLFSCSLDPVVHDEETIGDYFAYCTLAPYVEKQKVLVGQTVPESLPRYDSNVLVTLFGAGGISSFTHTKNGIYEEVSPCLPIIGDSVYTLNVLFPDGHQIEAHTRIPGDFIILEPQPGDTLYYQIGSRESPSTNAILPFVEWTTSKHTYYYQAEGRTEEIYGWDIARTNYTRIYVPYYPYHIINTIFPPEYDAQVQLVITAIDSSRVFSAISRWSMLPDSLDYKSGFNLIDEGNLSGINYNQLDIQGGIGFFNAVNQATCDFVLHVKVGE